MKKYIKSIFFFYISFVVQNIFNHIIDLYYSICHISKAYDLPFVDNIDIRITFHPSIIMYYTYFREIVTFANEYISNIHK